MKPARILLIVLGLAVAVGVVGLAVARTPAVQRWAVLKAIGPRPGFNLQLGRISAGISRLELGGVEVEKGGLRVKLERLEATYALLPMLFSHRLDIRQLVVTGLAVDASRLASARTQTAAVAGAPVIAPGLLTQVQLPFELVLGDIRLDGQALLAGAAGQPAIAMNFSATGGGFAPGHEGNLVLVSELKNPAAGARVEKLNARISLVATQTAGRTFSHAGLTAVVDATGKTFSPAIFTSNRATSTGSTTAAASAAGMRANGPTTMQPASASMSSTSRAINSSSSTSSTRLPTSPGWVIPQLPLRAVATCLHC
jgi:hypothetical protein